jgi:hypothetical protein
MHDRYQDGVCGLACTSATVKVEESLGARTIANSMR